MACQERGLRRARAEPVVPAHGPPGHGLERRQGQGAGVDRHQGRQGSRRRFRSGPSSRRRPPTSSSKRAARSSAAPTRSSSSNTFTSLPLIDAETLEFEVNVDGLVSTGGLGGPAILPLSLAKMSQLTQAFPDKSFSGIGGISTFEHALNYFLLGCGTVQVCTAAMLDHAIGPNVIAQLNDGLARFLEKHADKGWTRRRRLRRPAPRSRRRAVEDSPAGREGLPRRLRAPKATPNP